MRYEFDPVMFVIGVVLLLVVLVDGFFSLT